MSDPLLAEIRKAIDERLAASLADGAGAPPRLIEAMRYALLGAGKRLRPTLVVASGVAVSSGPPLGAGPLRDRLLTAGCAIEMIHVFSLIHDDLPALDDDDLRRGRPTLHVQYDEATAILAGDALLNLAFGTLCALGSSRLGEDAASPRALLRAIGGLSEAVGLSGMIAGQVLDLEAERVTVDAAALRRIHALKTGALIRASCEIGGILAGAGEEAIERLGSYGASLGLAFQIVDDILDVEGSAAELGKSPGKDARAGKATFPSLWGIEASRRQAAEAVDAACAAAAPLGDRAAPLVQIARGVLTRRG